MNDQSQSRQVPRNVVRPRIMLSLFAATFAVHLALLHPCLIVG